MNLELDQIDKILDEKIRAVKNNQSIENEFTEFKIERLINKLNELNRLIICSKTPSNNKVNDKVKELWVPYIDENGKNIGRIVIIS